MKGYPRVHERSKAKPQDNWGECDAIDCKEPAVWEVALQFSWFRSDDETLYCCAKHCTVRSVSEPADVNIFLSRFPGFKAR